MKKLFLLSIIFATIAIPAHAAKHRNPRLGLKRALWHMVLFDVFYLFNLFYLQRRL